MKVEIKQVKRSKKCSHCSEQLKVGEHYIELKIYRQYPICINICFKCLDKMYFDLKDYHIALAA